MKTIKFVILALFMVLSVGLTQEVSAQCPMCKQNVAAARANKVQVGNGLNTGILYLLVMPYLMVGAVGYFWYRDYKKKQQKLAS